ncbi:MAG TPA: hypothetical protein VK043_12140 [Burkholderiales bacterium]|nr:hypothetical protein [Burkholderiales bacterium]
MQNLAVLLLHALLAALLLVVAAYAQWRIGSQTAGRGRIWLTRSVFAAVGVAMGFVASRYVESGPMALLAFLQAFGIVHVPPAIIHFFKRVRRERPS